jgi:hypothetical protein
MKTTRRYTCLASAALGLIAMGGCQTWVPEAGLTLPSPRYLQHYPQYIPPSPSFPLQRELTSLEEASLPPAGAPAPMPRNVP